MTDMTDEQLAAGLSEARRIINQSAGYYFGGELTPFADAFKTLALRAIDRVAKDSERLNMGDGYQHGVLYALHHNNGLWGVYAIMGTADIWFSQAVTSVDHKSCTEAWEEFYNLPDEVAKLRKRIV